MRFSLSGNDRDNNTELFPSQILTRAVHYRSLPPPISGRVINQSTAAAFDAFNLCSPRRLRLSWLSLAARNHRTRVLPAAAAAAQ